VTKGDFSAAILAARQYALAAIGDTQFACLDAIVQRESRWNPVDLNRSSGAYGLPQAVPGSKMASAGADWATNPTTQLKWMLGYVHGRYGSACGALQHSNATGWY
jgi:hypothetical protein